MKIIRIIKILFAKTDNIFEDVLLDLMTPELLADVISLNSVEQNPQWHPEGNCLIHTKIVTNRIHKKFKNINLLLAGIFHDLGKFDTTKWDETKQSWTAFGHEDESIKYITKHKDWIIWMGGNVEKIDFIVKNHMRIKFIDEMRKKKRREFQSHKHFHLVKKFVTCDKGGF